MTDAVVGSDGAMYFTVGGRGTQSALYRVTYSGDLSTNVVDYQDSASSDRRAIRHELEAMHGTSYADLDFIFTNLGHPDRFIRYAARIALESMPVDGWRQRAISEPNSRALVIAIMALARQGETTDNELALQALERIDLSNLKESEQLAHALVFIRLGEPSEETRLRLITQWDPLYPASSGSDHLNMELVQLLTYLRAPSVIEKTLDLMDHLGTESAPDWSELAKRSNDYGRAIQSMMSNMPPTQAVHFALVLRNVKSG